MKHIISTEQFLDKKTLDAIFSLSGKMELLDKKNAVPQNLKGKIMACVFYEPSTRTRFSFESAMHKLGGSVITTENAAQFSSAIKGETLEDSTKIISGYSDIIILRHPVKGAALVASNISSVPVINAGDGAGEHPTQALLDIYTIKKELGDIDGIEITLMGDLLYGRTVHSLIRLLALYKVKINLVSPAQLKLPAEYKNYLNGKNIQFRELADIRKILEASDVLYVTRIQKERFSDQKQYEKLKDSYRIDKNVLRQMKSNAIIMHPLPRVNEIAPETDNDKRAAYFRQAKNGVYVRMALLQMVLSER